MPAARAEHRQTLAAQGEVLTDPVDRSARKATKRQHALLMIGFSTSVLLVLISAIFSAAQLSHGRDELMDALRKSERSSYLIGHIGVQLSRMRLLLRDVAPESPSPTGALAPLDTELRSSLAELGPLLRSHELQLWRGLEPQIIELRGQLFEAGSALDRGEGGRAATLMDGLVAKSSEIMSDLARLNGLNRLHTKAAFSHADRRLHRMTVTGMMASSALVAGITATWWIVLRVVRRQRAELDEHVQRVELANADLDAFAGRTAHDLRNMLSPLLLAVASLDLAHDATRLRAATPRIRRMVSRALALLDALLAFSKAGQVSGSNEICSVAAELQAVVEELAPAAERIGAQVEVGIMARNPMVECSAGLMGIVLRNVIGNAVKILDGAPRRRIRIEVRSSGQKWCDVLVEDSGPGIPEAALPHVFEPFYRVPGTRAPGTGIGLATVQRIVQAHRGRVLIASTRAEGTRVEIRFPLAPISADSASRRQLGGSASSSTIEPQMGAE